MSTIRELSSAVIIAASNGQTIALPADSVLGTTVANATPPLPGADPWQAGLASSSWGPVLVCAPFGLPPVTTPRREIRVAVLAVGPVLPRLAILLDGQAHLGTAAADTASTTVAATCPGEWHRPCRLGDGRQARFLDCAAVVRHLERRAAG